MKYCKERNIPIVDLSMAQAVVYISVHYMSPVLSIGDTAIGKTAIFKQLAKQSGFNVLSYNLSQVEATDLTGPIYPMANGKQSQYLPDGRVPIKGQENAREPLFLFFDEFNRGTDSAGNAAMSAFGDRRLGPHPLGPNVYVLAAMNPPNDKYNTSANMNTDAAIRRRICQIGIEFSKKAFQKYTRDPKDQKKIEFPEITIDWEFISWARNAPWNDYLRDFLLENTDLMYDRDAFEQGKLFGNPGSWEEINMALQTMDHYDMWKYDRLRQALRYKIGGHVGTSAAQSLMTFIEENRNTIDPEKVIREYNDRGEVYREVKQMMEDQLNDRLAILADNMAYVIYDQPEEDLADIADHVGQFVLDARPQFGEELLSGLEEYGENSEDGWTDTQDKVFAHLSRSDKFRQYTRENDILTNKMEKKMRSLR